MSSPETYHTTEPTVDPEGPYYGFVRASVRNELGADALNALRRHFAGNHDIAEDLLWQQQHGIINRNLPEVNL